MKSDPSFNLTQNLNISENILYFYISAVVLLVVMVTRKAKVHLCVYLKKLHLFSSQENTTNRAWSSPTSTVLILLSRSEKKSAESWKILEEHGFQLVYSWFVSWLFYSRFKRNPWNRLMNVFYNLATNCLFIRSAEKSCSRSEFCGYLVKF